MEKNVNFKSIILFTHNNLDIVVSAVFHEGIYWFTKQHISELYDKDIRVITRYINNIFVENELDKKSHVRRWFMKNVYVKVQFFSLDVVLALGYRIKSFRGQQFRKWLTSVAKDKMLLANSK
ncbi:MAG: RhuM family protein [Neisseriaceae bacterium]